ncbi:MAG: phosphodiester glycosidase family protein [Mycobacteriales bacterium]
MRLPDRPLLVAALAAVLAAPALPALVAASPAAAQDSQAAVTAPPDLGYDRIGVRRGDTWYLRDALDGGPNRSYREHVAGWQPVAGDTDGDGIGTVSLFKDGVWLLRDDERGTARTVRFGLKGDQPVLGDWNGDGIDTIGVFRGGRWYVRDVNLSGPARIFGYGLPGDVAVVGDWDGNGRTDIGVRRGVRWYQRDAVSSGPTHRIFDFGLRGDIPISGDWDHDGRDTPGLFRAGTWFFRVGNFPSPYQTTRFGLAGDRPVVRRVPGLAPGVRHDVVRDPRGPWTAHVATVDLAAASTPETVLAGGRLQGLEAVSGMTRRSGAVLGINGDYALSSGRPVHMFANDGRLAQTPQTLGRALSFDAHGADVRMGYPDLRVEVSTASDTGTTTLDVPQVNSGGPYGDLLAAFTADGALLEVPPNGACYAGLAPTGGRTMTGQGTVSTSLQVTGTRCGGERPVVPTTGAMLTANRYHGNDKFIRSLGTGQSVQLSARLGFPGAVDVLGGNPLLVVGRRVAGDVNGSGAFFDRHPRTAVGVTDAGQLLLVVVDGRQGSYSAGMTLRELADFMLSLGARDAINLDGGGSSELFLNGLVANRPSDGGERSVSSALVVLPGADAGQSDLTAPRPLASSNARTAPPAEEEPAAGADRLLGPAVTDPASTGGLADALRRSGVPLPAELRQAADAFARRPR